MEQKKRRFRPTLTAYRRLEGLLKEAKEVFDNTFLTSEMAVFDA